MLTPFKKVMENPEDIPNIPRGVMEYLQVHFNAGFVMNLGKVAELKQQGYSDAFVAGFLSGIQYCSNMLDDAEAVRKELQELNKE
ncbi:MAG: phage protein [Clostridium sp.]|nr:phage protein [Clostridium sp.]